MKLLPLIILFAFSAIASPIVTNNTGAGTAEDTLSLTFFVTDTVGNFAAADSFYVMIFSPTGDSVFAAAYIASANEIHSITLGTSGRKGYRWTKEVAAIDGASPRSGTYSGILVAVDTLDGPSAVRLDQGFTFSFILEPTLADRAKIGDTCADNKLAVVADSVKVDLSSFNAALDNDTSLVTFLRAGIGGEGGGGCSGSGAYGVTFVAVDSTTGQVIPGADIAIRNLEQTALIALGQTTPLGRTTLNLNTAQYVLLADAPGYIFTSTDTITVIGSQTDTIFGYHFDPGTPASPDLCRVYGFLYGINGQAEPSATVTASIPSGVARRVSPDPNIQPDLIISPFITSTTTDSLGYFALDLIPSDLLTPSGTKYEITITRRDGTILRQRLRVPTTPTWQLDW